MSKDDDTIYLPHGSEGVCFWCMKRDECDDCSTFSYTIILNCTGFTADLAKIKDHFGTIKVGVRGG